MEVDCSEGVHQGVVHKLQVLALPHIEQVFREEDVEDAGEEHVDHNKDHQREELARAPVESEQLEGEESGNNLGLKSWMGYSLYETG